MNSDNGWPGISEKDKTYLTFVGGDENLYIRTANAEVGKIFRFLITFFHNEVETIDGPILDDWSWAYRLVRGSVGSLSCHASGTAVDLNALQHPRGVRKTFTAEQVQKLRKILARFIDPHTSRSVILWGGDFTTTVDEMHFQIRGDQAAVVRVLTILESQLPSVEDVWNADIIPYNQVGSHDPVDPKNPNRTPVVILEQMDRLIRTINDRLDKIEQALETK